MKHASRELFPESRRIDEITRSQLEGSHEFRLWPAEVFNNIDPMGQGRVQIFIPFFMKEWFPTDYPWARQFRMGTGGGFTQGSSWTPEIGSKVWVFFENEEYKEKPYILADLETELMNPATSLLDAQLATLVSGWTSTMPYAKFIILQNNVGIAMSSLTPEVAIFTPTANINIDTTGKIKLSSLVGVDLGKTAIGRVLTTITDPLVDNITGSPHIGSTTIMAQS